MAIDMKYLFLLLTIFFLRTSAFAQQDTVTEGTITVKKKGQKKTLVDQVRGRLVLVDQYGKALDSSRVVSFDMVIAVNEKMNTYSAKGSSFDHVMREQLMLASEGTIIYFKNVKAKNEKGEIESYPGTVIKAGSKNINSAVLFSDGIRIDTIPNK